MKIILIIKKKKMKEVVKLLKLKVIAIKIH